MKPTYKTNIFACFVAYVVQAIVNNFAPLLFVTFQNTYSIPLSQITLLVTINFAVQLCVDLLATKLVDKIGYRPCIITSQAVSAVGLSLLTFLPEVIDPFTGILIAVIVYAIGGGLMEVLVSPIVESCPTDNKEKAMSLLHSFYCWGTVGVVLLSTLFFWACGIENWRILTCVWAAIPVINSFLFAQAPIAPLLSEDEKGMSVRQLFASATFWLFVCMMFFTGASEQSVSQWASVFAEQGLGISKTAGDLAGPMTFAICMGIARTFYGKKGDKINLDVFMLISGALCIFSYLLASITPWAWLNLVGCALCGFSTAIMWPGSFSKSTVALKTGGTAMFALLALAGDLGCSLGPTLVGFVSDAFAGDMKMGIFAATVFPVLLTVTLLIDFFRKRKKAKKSQNEFTLAVLPMWHTHGCA